MNPTASSDSSALHLQFFRAMMNLRQAGHRLHPPCKELSHFEFMCLDVINDYQQDHSDLPSIKASELSKITQTSRPAISQHLNALEGNGYLERIASKNDRRVTYLALTEKGKEFLCKRESDFQKSLCNLCDQLGHEDTKQFIKLLDRLSEILTESNKDPT